MIIAGLTNDLFFNNCQCLLLVIWNLVTILWNFWDMVYPAHNEEYIGWTLSLFGIASGFSDMYIMILLPMSLACRNRLLAYELTMLGTIIAIVNFCMFFTTSLLSTCAIELIKKDIHLGNIFNRCLVIVTVALSTWAFWSSAKMQFHDLRWRHQERAQAANSRKHSSIAAENERQTGVSSSDLMHQNSFGQRGTQVSSQRTASAQ